MPLPPITIDRNGNSHGVCITDFNQPADGAAIITLCPHCRKLEVLWSDIALKPPAGVDLFNTVCARCWGRDTVYEWSIETLHFPLEAA